VNYKGGKGRIELRELNLKTGESKILHTTTIELGIEDRINILQESYYAFIWEDISDDDLKPARLIDVRTGQETDLGLMNEYNEGYDWSPEHGYLLYVKRREKNDDALLTILSPEEGVIGQKQFPARDTISTLRLSPDGNRVLFCHTPRDKKYISSGISRFMIWDSRNQTQKRITYFNIMQGFYLRLSGLTSKPEFSRFQWSPDGKSVILPFLHINIRSEDTKVFPTLERIRIR
jgi:hypothetical protein